jgi:helix-turn-helix protein
LLACSNWSAKATAKGNRHERGYMGTPLTSPPPVSDTVTLLTARLALGVGQRQICRLINSGKLQVEGTGAWRRILRSSLNAELRRRKYPDIAQDIPEIAGHLVEKSATWAIDENAEASQSKNMHLRFPGLSPGTSLRNLSQAGPVSGLLSIPRAAARAGISDELMRTAVRAGQCPATKVGSRYMIDVEELLRWKRGERGGR